MERRGNTGGSDAVVHTDAVVETDAYDALPRRVRRCIASQPLKISALQAKELCDAGVPVGTVCAHIERFSREHMAKARAEGR